MMRSRLSTTRFRQALGHGSLASAGVVTLLLSGATLLISLFTGVIIARELAPSGRGEVAAAIVAAQIAGIICSVGARPAIAYFVAKDVAISGELLSTWLVLWVILSAAGIGLIELLLPALQAAQTSASIAAARVYVFIIAGVCLGEIICGCLIGDERYLAWNLIRFLQPITLLGTYVLLWVFGHFTVESALAGSAASVAVVPVVGLLYQLPRHPFAPPSLRLARQTLSFGARGLPGVAAFTVNARLDLLIMPAVLPAATVGLYAVASNTSSVVYLASSTLNSLVLPSAVRRGARGPSSVITFAFSTLIINLTLAAALVATCSWLVPLVYGRAFSGAVLPLMLLLPGAIVFSPMSVLTAGLESLGRPGLSSVPPVISAGVTVVGLAAFLESGGATAAALITSTAYSVGFLIALGVFKRTSGLSWRAIVSGCRTVFEIARSRGGRAET